MAKYKVGDKIKIKPEENNTGMPVRVVWTIDKVNEGKSPLYDISTKQTWGVEEEDIEPDRIREQKRLQICRDARGIIRVYEEGVVHYDEVVLAKIYVHIDCEVGEGL